VVVEIGIEVGDIEVLQEFSVAAGWSHSRDVYGSPRHSGFYQALSLLWRGRLLVCSISKFVEQARDDGIDKLAAVVGVKAQDAEGKLPDHGGRTGSNQTWLMRGVEATISHCATSSTALM